MSPKEIHYTFTLIEVQYVKVQYAKLTLSQSFMVCRAETRAISKSTGNNCNIT
jgi:hypothetical protein